MNYFSFIEFEKMIEKLLNKIRNKFNSRPVEETFTEIYEKNLWGSDESISGPGSDLSQTKFVIEIVQSVVERYDIKSITDIPCGDFNWMQRVDLSNIKYIGCDIVEKLIEDNNRKFSRDNIAFKKLEILNDTLPNTDLILCRDLLVHFSYKDTKKAITNIIASGSKYLLTTTFTDRNTNEDIITGSWRPINLMLPPFNFPKAVEIINENCTEENGKFSDKSLGFWEISSLKIN